MQAIHGGDIYRNQVEVDFSVNTNPLGMPKTVEEALQKAVGRCREYPDRMAEHLKTVMSQSLPIPAENLLFGNGASEIFMGIVHGLRPKKIGILVPSFYGYEYVAEAVSSEVIFIPLQEKTEFVPGEEMLQALTEDMDILFLANPNNPTGKQMSKGYLRQLLELCREKEIYVVLDECFIEFVEGAASMITEIGKYRNLLLVRAFTKIYGIPGVRLGYLLCSNQPLLDRIERQLPEWNLSTFAQEAGIACVGETSFVEQTKACIKEERSFLVEGLRKMDLRVFHSDANFILFYSEKPLYEKLLQQGILIRDCSNFRGLSKGYYRIAVKQRLDNEKLLKAIGDCIA